MGCAYQLFKICVIVVTLVNVGTGYMKFYQLFADIADTVSNAGSTQTLSDLIWIPYLIVQVCTTIFQVLQLYCLIRELCEDNYMDHHFFKCCFILVVLIYTISVLPKSILTIVYYNYDSDSDVNWWKFVTDFFDSTFSGLAAFGFQVILFMPVIRRTLRSAGVCRMQISPMGTGETKDALDEDTDIDNGTISNDKSGCCILFCCKTNEIKISVDSVEKGNEYIHETINVKPDPTIKTITRNVAFVADKGVKLKSSIDNKNAKLELKARNINDKQVKKLEQKIEDRKLQLNSKLRKQNDQADYNAGSMDGSETRLSIDREQSNCCFAKCCHCLENRTLCFIITMAMANFHYIIYMIEIVFMFCFGC